MKRRPKVEKPEVRVVVMRNGSMRIINAALGAEYAGVKPASFAAYIRRHYGRTVSIARPTVAERILSAYPELFNLSHKKRKTKNEKQCVPTRSMP